MKKNILHSIAFFLMLLTLELQAEISFTVSKRDVACNRFTLGRIEVTVINSNPPYTFQWNSGQTSNVINDLNPGDYTLTITDDTGADTTIVVSVREIVCEVNPALVFTPNGDGYNDTWQIDNIQYYPENLILVYNRWGQKIFEHQGLYEPWDGKDLLGVPVSDGVYYYVIYQDKNNKKSIVKATVSVVR
jgi:gliding motility-associated-like protein